MSLRAAALRVTVVWLVAGGLLGACSREPAREASPLGFQPQSAAFEVPFGGEVSEDFRLTAGAKGEAAIGGATSLALEGAVDPDLRVEPLPPEPGRGPGLRIHAAGRRVGVRVGTLQVVARPGPSRPIPLLYALRVRGTLTVVPTNPLVDLRAADPAALITVHDSQADFAVTAAEVTAGPFAATVAPAPDGAGYQVRVTPVTDRFPAGQRGAAGTLVIRSNDRIEPRKEIPLFAFGRAP